METLIHYQSRRWAELDASQTIRNPEVGIEYVYWENNFWREIWEARHTAKVEAILNPGEKDRPDEILLSGDIDRKRVVLSLAGDRVYLDFDDLCGHGEYLHLPLNCRHYCLTQITEKAQ